MKVLHAMAGASVGGAETFFVDAVRAIDELGIEQNIVTRNNNQHKIEVIEGLNLPLQTVSFNRRFKWSTQSALNKQIVQFEPDIVHHWMGRAGMFSRRGKHVNIGWYGGYYKPERFKHCTHHVAVTQDIADHIVRAGVDASNVHVLHVYADFEKAEPLNREAYGTPNDVPLLISLSRLHSKKGLDTLLYAMQQVDDAHLWIAGSGPLEQELKALTQELNLENRVKFLGWRYDREALLATADICVFPSRYEPFGAVVIEAWATATPLVVAKAAGPKAYVSHEKDGLLVEVDDVNDLANNINQLIKDQHLQGHLMINGVKNYEQHFTKEVFKRNVQNLYQDVQR